MEMAVADAYGISFEFVDRKDWPGANDLSQFRQHPTYSELLPGQYTDDTQRALANARVVLTGNHLDPRAYAEAYVDIYSEDPREGYSRRYQEFLKENPNAKEFLLNVKRSAKSNGSLMGVAPLGFIKDIREVKLAAMIQALTTHAPSTAVHAQIVAMSAHFFIHELGPKEDLVDFLKFNADLEDEWDYITDKMSPTTIRAKSVVNTLLTGLAKHTYLTDMIRWAVELEGDTDSAAATLVAVAACGDDFINDIKPMFPNKDGHPLYQSIWEVEGERRMADLRNTTNLLYDRI